MTQSQDREAQGPEGTLWPWHLVETLFSDSRDALVLFDAGERVIAANEEWHIYCGHESNVAGRPVNELTAGGAPSEFADVVRRATANCAAIEQPVTLRHLRGFDLKIDLRVAPVEDASSTVVGYVGRLRPSSGLAASLA